MSTQSEILESTLECSICMSIICEPITISCGHSFCRVCLVKSLKKNRAVCHIAAETAEENIMLKNICTTFYSELYQQRFLEIKLEKNSWSDTLPIFYYNDCHFPGYNLRLNLFETRYKIMMQRIVNSNRKFAYVPNFTNYCAKVGDVALLASLTECQFLPDGCCLIQAKLTERKLISEHYIEDGTQNLHFCVVESLTDTLISPQTTENYYEKAVQISDLINACHAILNGVLSPRRRDIESMFGPPPVVVNWHTLGGAISTQSISSHPTPRQCAQADIDDLTSSADNGGVSNNRSSLSQTPTLNQRQLELFSLWMVSLSPLSQQTQYDLLSSTDTLARLEAVVNSFITRLGRSILNYNNDDRNARSSAIVSVSSDNDGGSGTGYVSGSDPSSVTRHDQASDNTNTVLGTSPT